MSDDKLVDTLRKASTAIYIATDEETAKQISITFMRAANRITELEAIIEAAPHSLECGATSWDLYKRGPCDCWKSKIGSK